MVNYEEIFKEREASGIDQYIIKLDHVAYRVKRGDREILMGELMNALPYRLFKHFKAISSNATTTALKLFDTTPIIVISEGLTDDSVVENYCQKFGSRVHHLAYEVSDIDKVVEIQKARGI
ncbi:MAG: VOC family protein, partial [Candidatus Heimdallarchaeota archaeon]